MYIERLAIQNFKSFEAAEVAFQCPGAERKPFDNLTLLVGQNSSGKTSILRAVCLGVLGQVLSQSGYQPRFLVRASGEQLSCQIRTRVQLEEGVRDLEVMIDRKRDFQFIHAREDLGDDLYDERSAKYFLAGYGANRWVPLPSNFESPSSRDQARKRPYQRVASLFEDQFGLIPAESWLGEFIREYLLIDPLKDLANALLQPTGLAFEVLSAHFVSNGLGLPAIALSDGYRSYLAWVFDLLYHLWQVLPTQAQFTDIKGVVLIDEIDLHMHASWQRVALKTISECFPNLQFIVTSHSPIVAGSIPSENIRVVRCVEGRSELVNLEQSIHGLDADQILLTPYFGLDSTRAEAYHEAYDQLYRRASEGDREARMRLLRMQSEGL